MAYIQSVIYYTLPSRKHATQLAQQVISSKRKMQNVTGAEKGASTAMPIMLYLQKGEKHVILCSALSKRAHFSLR